MHGCRLLRGWLAGGGAVARLRAACTALPAYAHAGPRPPLTLAAACSAAASLLLSAATALRVGCGRQARARRACASLCACVSRADRGRAGLRVRAQRPLRHARARAPLHLARLVGGALRDALRHALCARGRQLRGA